MALSTDEIKIKNLLNMYDTLTLEQIAVFGNLKTNHQKKIINDLLKKKAIKQDYLSDDGIEVYSNFYTQPIRKYVLIGEALKELTVVLNTPVLWFQKQEYPFAALAFIKNKMFDIAVIENGEENVFNAVLNRVISTETGEDDCINAPAARENILIIVENEQQIDCLKIIHQNVMFACVNLKEHSVQFLN